MDALLGPNKLQFWQLRTWIQTIILTWQLILTLDSIRNSCDVYYSEMGWMGWDRISERTTLQVLIRGKRDQNEPEIHSAGSLAFRGASRARCLACSQSRCRPWWMQCRSIWCWTPTQPPCSKSSCRLEGGGVGASYNRTANLIRIGGGDSYVNTAVGIMRKVTMWMAMNIFQNRFAHI